MSTSYSLPFQLTRLLLHRSRLSTSGVTLFELLITILIISILAAVALPSFANQIVRSRETKAKVQLRSVNRAQHAYRLENSSFADSLDRLGLINSDGDYDYTITEASSNRTIVKAHPRDDLLRGYLAVTSHVSSGSVESAICEGTPGNIPTISSCP
ncbi:MAG TPA: type IV pilin-like G/H family protein [Trichocoleus sp.]